VFGTLIQKAGGLCCLASYLVVGPWQILCASGHSVTYIAFVELSGFITADDSFCAFHCLSVAKIFLLVTSVI
jgi:hypothetical protein